ncbi:MAG TPA: hypothetical protein VMC85_18670 [Desulfomonilaceae bacterium]|nr:hypothetical protein [Desulfomonilaceae bacterium]
MKTKRLGALIAGVGALYLIIVAWIASWWYVPAYLTLGPQTILEQASYGGKAFFVLWAISGVLGALLVAIGAAVYSAIDRFRLLILSASSTLLLVWLAIWSASSPYPVVFGIGGGLILLCFFASCLAWARTRCQLNGSMKTAADLRLAGYVCFFLAAWGLCGLLGAPVFALRPEVAEAYGSSPGAYTMAVKILVCLLLGWGFTAIGQITERRYLQK